MPLKYYTLCEYPLLKSIENNIYIGIKETYHSDYVKIEFLLPIKEIATNLFLQLIDSNNKLISPGVYCGLLRLYFDYNTSIINIRVASGYNINNIDKEIIELQQIIQEKIDSLKVFL